MHGLIGSFKAVEGKRAELVSILLAGVGAMPGCRSYVVAEDPTDEDTLWVTEVWDSAASHKASLQLPAVKAAIAQAMPLIAGFGERREIRPVGGHGMAAGAAAPGEDAVAILAAAIAPLEAGWNAADGDRFAEPFADDADFVNVRGEHIRGKTAIARGHAGIFASIYKDSRNRIAVAAARRLGDDVIVGQVSAALTVPAGPLAGEHAAMASVVLVRSGGTWQIETFHNTLVAPPPPAAAAR